MTYRFYLFICDRFYPDGGWRDFVQCSNSIEELLEFSEAIKDQYEMDADLQIIDIMTLSIVKICELKIYNEKGEVSYFEGTKKWVNLDLES